MPLTVRSPPIIVLPVRVVAPVTVNAPPTLPCAEATISPTTLIPVLVVVNFVTSLYKSCTSEPSVQII